MRNVISLTFMVTGATIGIPVPASMLFFGLGLMSLSGLIRKTYLNREPGNLPGKTALKTARPLNDDLSHQYAENAPAYSLSPQI